MRTQRTIALIVLAALACTAGAVALLIWWLGAPAGLAAAAGGALLLITLYMTLIRPWHLRWGATPEEATAAMPGDELVPNGVVSTRAISIDGSPDEVWPWLVQIGFGRAGWYSYDWIDNDGIPSADTILPDLQTLAIGDQIEIIPGMGPTVVAIDPERALVGGADDGTSSWCLQLVPDGETTRLISRWRNNFDITPATALMVALTDPGAFVMEQKMLRTIRDRVEAREKVAA